MDHLEEMKAAMREVMQDEMKDFYIDRKTHFQHHEFLTGLKSGIEGCQSVIGKVSIAALIGGLITVIVMGVVSWIRKSLGMG